MAKIRKGATLEGPIVYKGHAIHPEIRLRWAKWQREINHWIEEFRQELVKPDGSLDQSDRQILALFGQSALADVVLFHQFLYWIQRAEAAGDEVDTRLQATNAACKVAATWKGPQFHRLLALREIEKRSNRTPTDIKDADLETYLNATEQQSEASKKAAPTRQKNPPTAKGTARTVDASFLEDAEPQSARSTP